MTDRRPESIKPESVNPEYKQAVQAQSQAAHPKYTRLVSANAGSGKTRVLVDRVSRILLSDTAPEKILCLTYTKAAASEMQARLFDTLGEWSVMPAEALKDKLQALLGTDRDLPDLKTARALFAKALETPDGLKVQTIHAFCERIVSRFPIESGILPGFEPLDDSDMRVLQDRVKQALLQACAEQADGPLNQALQTLAVEKADQTLDSLFEWMGSNGDKIQIWAQTGLGPLAEILGIDARATVEDAGHRAWTEFDPNTRRAKAAELGESPSVTDQKIARKMLDAFDFDISEPQSPTQTPVQMSVQTPIVATGQTVSKNVARRSTEAFLIYAQAFLTQSGDLRKKITTQQALPSVQNFFAPDGAEVTRVMQALQNIRSAHCLEMTRAVFVLAQDYTKRFEAFKRLDRRLDFSDQILLVRDLLINSEVSDWVRYKLDGGVEHILLDEAQDTAPTQWEIIDALAEPFFQDSPERMKHVPRTLFAVGDEKQSIYSFQGAEPEKFLDKIQYYTASHLDVRGKSQQVRMRMSFRSAPEILKFVDQIFVKEQGRQRMFDPARHPPASDLDGHTAHRSDSGRVEFWPLAFKPDIEKEREAWDTRPVNALASGDQREQLALGLARTIKHWLADKTPIFDRDLKTTRPMKAGDILILVCQRNAFFDAIIRNLKAEGVAVAGADRLKLKDSIAVQDLLALARFVLLPTDDLSLAEVLKSPLFGFDEAALFDVATRRDQNSLWQTLRTRRPETAARLSELILYSRRLAPYEFFARVLATLNAAGISLTQCFYQRLGMEAKDALEAFLSIALSHQRQNAPSLQHFITHFERDDPILKREMDTVSAGLGQVRVMTVHGAKGLEAPVVFLPDTTQVPTLRGPLTAIGTESGDGGFVLSGASAIRPTALEPYIEARKARDMQEYMRLLYVAMTRAESRLIICGYQDGRKTVGYSEGAWYQEVERAFAGLTTETIETPFGEGLAFGAGAAPLPSAVQTGQPKTDIDIPDWARQAAPSESLPYQRVTPSHLLVEDNQASAPVRSPLNHQAEIRYGRGVLIHKLLEILPDIEKTRREAIGRAYLSLHIQDKDDSERKALQIDTILAEVMAVLNAPEFSEIFGIGSRAEVSLAGRAKTLPKTLYLNGQIDRLCVTDENVYIVDYKSNRPPPKSPAGVAPLYLAQMAAYRELAREIYPDKAIVCALLWTDGPDLMVLDDFQLDEALTQVKRLLT